MKLWRNRVDARVRGTRVGDLARVLQRRDAFQPCRKYRRAGGFATQRTKRYVTPTAMASIAAFRLHPSLSSWRCDARALFERQRKREASGESRKTVLRPSFHSVEST